MSNTALFSAHFVQQPAGSAQQIVPAPPMMVQRGYPLVALLAILGGWMGGRLVAAVPLLSPPVLRETTSQWPQWSMPRLFEAAGQGMSSPSQNTAAWEETVGPQSYPGDVREAAFARTAPLPKLAESDEGRGKVEPPRLVPQGLSGSIPVQTFAFSRFEPTPRKSGILQHLWEDFARIPVVQGFYAPPVPTPASPYVAPPASGQRMDQPLSKPKRWSADLWSLQRKERQGRVLSTGYLPAAYGGSQTGAILRYYPAWMQRHRPAVYVRTTMSTGLIKDSAMALGVSARPVPAVPVTAGVEARVIQQGGQKRFQPAVIAVTEIPPFPVTNQWRAEVYGQAGYVGGDFATPFADGQMKVDRPFQGFGKYQTRIGAGVWGGAQKGAHRVDVGPSVSVDVPLGKAFGRVSVDWRFRVMGNAKPDSGPAMTLSAGF